jgi:hypothetical protein
LFCVGFVREEESQREGYLFLVYTDCQHYIHFHSFISLLKPKCGPHIMVSMTTSFFYFLHMNNCKDFGPIINSI